MDNLFTFSVVLIIFLINNFHLSIIQMYFTSQFFLVLNEAHHKCSYCTTIVTNTRFILFLDIFQFH